jgi:hypothetical protein
VAQTHKYGEWDQTCKRECTGCTGWFQLLFSCTRCATGRMKYCPVTAVPNGNSCGTGPRFDRCVAKCNPGYRARALYCVPVFNASALANPAVKDIGKWNDIDRGCVCELRAHIACGIC